MILPPPLLASACKLSSAWISIFRNNFVVPPAVIAVAVVVGLPAQQTPQNHVHQISL